MSLSFCAIYCTLSIEDGLIPNYSSDDLMLSTGHEIFLIHGKKLMALAHDLYARCMR